jgi:hypothetical protein
MENQPQNIIAIGRKRFPIEEIALVEARRLPPSAEIWGSSRFDPVGPSSTAMTRLPSSASSAVHRRR